MHLHLFICCHYHCCLSEHHRMPCSPSTAIPSLLLLPQSLLFCLLTYVMLVFCHYTTLSTAAPHCLPSHCHLIRSLPDALPSTATLCSSSASTPCSIHFPIHHLFSHYHLSSAFPIHSCSMNSSASFVLAIMIYVPHHLLPYPPHG